MTDQTRRRRETDLSAWREGEGRLLGVGIPQPRDGHLSVAVPPDVARRGSGAVRPEPAGQTGGAPDPHDRVVTLPNAISLGRVLLIPFFVLCVLHWQAPGWALGILAVVGFSDWLDGKIARLWDMHSRLGEKLDPLADRILVLVVPVVFALAGYVPLWVVVVLAARDLVLAGTLPVYRRRGLVPEVIYLGKAATFALFWSFPLLLAVHADVPGEEGWRLLGEACLYWGVGLYLWSGVVYLVQAVRVAGSVAPRRGGRV